MGSYLSLFDHMLVRIGLIVFIFACLKTLVRPIARQLLKISKAKPKLIQEKRLITAMGFINGIASIILWSLALIIILIQFHIDIKTLLTGAGILGIVFGLAFQSMIKDFVTSFSLLISGFYEVGDEVAIAGVTGTVKEINLKNTILEEKNGAIHFVPNSEIKVISNFSKKHI